MPPPPSWQRRETNMEQRPGSEEADGASDHGATPHNASRVTAERATYWPQSAPLSARYRDLPPATAPSPTTHDARRERFEAATTRYFRMDSTDVARGAPFDGSSTVYRRDENQLQQQQQHHQELQQQQRLNSLTPPSPQEPNHEPVHPAAADASHVPRTKIPDMHELTRPFLTSPLFLSPSSPRYSRGHVNSAAGHVPPGASSKLTQHYPTSANPRQMPMTSLPQPRSYSPFEGQTSTRNSEHGHDCRQQSMTLRLKQDHQAPLTALESSVRPSYRDDDQSQRHLVAPSVPRRLAEKRKADITPPPGSAVAALSSVLTPFIYKLYCLVSDEATDELCHWTDSGDSFVVPDPTTFAITVLPQYFKHNQFPSFVRQLNKYRFHKLLPGSFSFGHPKFLRDKPELLPEIARQRSPERVPQNMQTGAGVGSDCIGDTNDGVNSNSNFLDPSLPHARDHGSHQTSSISLDQNILRTSGAEPNMKRRRFSMPAVAGSQRTIPIAREQGFDQEESTQDEDCAQAASCHETRGRHGTSLLASSSKLRTQVDRLVSERAGLNSRIASLEEQVARMSHKILELENLIHRRGNS